MISYKREDVAVARQVRQALRAEGLEVWWDENLQGGQRWDSALDEVLIAADAIVTLWSPRSVQSDWVKHEASIGKARGTLVPAQMAECDIPPAFASIQTPSLIDWDGSEKDGRFRAFLGAIRNIARKRRRIRTQRIALTTVAAAGTIALGIAADREYRAAVPKPPSSQSSVPATLLASFEFDNTFGSTRGSSKTGWNVGDTSAKLSGGMLCTEPGESFHAAFYVFDDPTSFSFLLRFKAESFSALAKTIVSLGEGYRWFVLNESRGRLELELNNGDFATVFAKATIAAQTWHSVFVSMDEYASNVTVLLDGTNEFEYAMPTKFRFNVHDVLKADRMEAGFSLGSSTTHFVGCIDDIKVYSRAVNRAEMKELATASLASQ